MWRGGGESCCGRGSRRSLGIRDCGLGCSDVVSMFSALVVSLSNMDMNCWCMAGVMWFLMVVFVRALR